MNDYNNSDDYECNLWTNYVRQPGKNDDTTKLHILQSNCDFIAINNNIDNLRLWCSGLLNKTLECGNTYLNNWDLQLAIMNCWNPNQISQEKFCELVFPDL